MPHLEIEKRYLCNANNIVKYLKKEGKSYIIEKLEQFYLIAKPGQTLRYRKENNRYIKNQKIGTGLIREEREKEVSKKEYNRAKAKNSGGVIVKDRYKFIVESNLYELDIFKGSLKGLAILEIEFKDIDSANSYKIPKALKKYIIKDITNENIYSNGALSRSMKVPLRSDSILSLNEIKKDKKILAKPKTDLYISDYENSKDALLNTIDRLLLCANINIKSFFNYNDIKYLKRVNRATNRVKALINGYKKYIKKSSYNEILFNINNILLHFEKALTLQTTLESLLKQKSKLPLNKQLPILKELIHIAQKEKKARENLDKESIKKLINSLSKSIHKSKFKNIEKPFSYLKEPILKSMKKRVKKAIKCDSIYSIYSSLKEYKTINSYFLNNFKLQKELKQIKNIYKNSVCSLNSKLCKKQKSKKAIKELKKAL